MTLQMIDNFSHGNALQIVADTSHGGLFSPYMLGMDPRMPHTGCWRGYHAVFAVRDGVLVLQTLRVNLLVDYRRVQGPTINGVTPPGPPPEPLTRMAALEAALAQPFSNVYQDVNHPLDYTGGVLIANLGVDRPGQVGGPIRPWSLRRVTELVLEHGVLQRQADRSAAMEALRDMQTSGLSIEHTGAEVSAFIRRSFDCAYSF